MGKKWPKNGKNHRKLKFEAEKLRVTELHGLNTLAPGPTCPIVSPTWVLKSWLKIKHLSKKKFTPPPPPKVVTFGGGGGVKVNFFCYEKIFLRW